jgi:nicotinamidase-related amidase
MRPDRSASVRGRAGVRPRVVAAKGTALLLIDVINDLDFPGATALIEAADPMASRIAELKRRAVSAGIPVVYVNDNFGQWRSDFRRTVAHCTSATSPGRRVSRRLKPGPNDYFVLKPRHSGFFATTLEVLLADLGARRLILTGIAGDMCVLFTANDAYVRHYVLLVPSDCVASNSVDRTEAALTQMKTVLRADIRPSDQLTFRNAGRGGQGSGARRQIRS